jgi:hypothetical protein
MCGFFYSSFGRIQNISLQDLAVRGPDGVSELDNELGYFYHSRLATQQNVSVQPVQNNHGVLLYNGTEYSLKQNDTD